ncbi:MAG: tetratricopeptide repeat protein [Bdellovibrionales bacterium]
MIIEKIKNFININSIYSWVAKHLKSLFIGFVTILLVLIGGGVFLEWKSNHEKKLYGDFYLLQKQLQMAGEKANGKDYRKKNKDLVQLMKSFNEKNPKKDTYSQEMKDIATKYESFIQDYKGQKIGTVFAIDLADFFYSNDEKARAQDLLALFAFPKKKSTLYQLASFQLANYHMNEKNCEEALKIWQDLSTNKKAPSFHKDSKIQSALCYENSKEYKKAKDLYLEIIKKNPNALDKQKIQESIYFLTLKQKIEAKK